MFLAFLAGLASFFSPCVLPIIPVYLAFLTQTSLAEVKAPSARPLVLAHAACFILGFSLVFIALGASASAVGALLFRRRELLERAGGAVLVLLGLWMLGVFRSAALYKDIRFHFREKPAGFAGSALVGAAFAAGWTPCVGPVLTAILGLAAREGSLLKGVLLLSLYSLGFALPLLAFALAAERAAKVLDRVKPALPWIEAATGAVLLALGLVMAAGRYSRISTWVLSISGGR